MRGLPAVRADQDSGLHGCTGGDASLSYQLTMSHCKNALHYYVRGIVQPPPGSPARRRRRHRLICEGLRATGLAVAPSMVRRIASSDAARAARSRSAASRT